MRIDETQRGLVADAVVDEVGALAVQVDRVAVLAGLGLHRVGHVGASRIGGAQAQVLRVGAVRRRAQARRVLQARSVLERGGEVKIAGHKAGRVGVGDVAGDHLLALRAQQERVGLEVQSCGHLFKHGVLQTGLRGAAKAQACTDMNASMGKLEPLQWPEQTPLSRAFRRFDGCRAGLKWLTAGMGWAHPSAFAPAAAGPPAEVFPMNTRTSFCFSRSAPTHPSPPGPPAPPPAPCPPVRPSPPLPPRAPASGGAAASACAAWRARYAGTCLYPSP